MIRADADRAPADRPVDGQVRTPTVLAVLVAGDGAPWLRECLQGLSGQSYPRLGVVAVDNGSTDGSRELLERALGPGRVLELGRDAGLAASVDRALELPVASESDYLLVLHDDTVLEPDTVAGLVETAGSVERAGVVGPKVVDWDDPRILREVGRSTDRFGHPTQPLQDGEIDHGQYDRVIEVLFVSSCAMLVSREVWQTVGALDERLTSHHEDLDLCWRARLAGFKVVMTPLARVRHASATSRGAREDIGKHRSERYYAERASLTAMLKNYSIGSLLVLLPFFALIGLGRTLLLTVTRRFEDAWELLSGWGWNVVHLPGTLARRRRTQRVRTVPDREIRRFMESATFRIPRWVDEANKILAEQQQIDEGEESFRVREHAASLIRRHPALVGVAVAAVVVFLAGGRILGADDLGGGALAAFPASAGGFFAELVSGVRTTGLGGTDAASPSLAALGSASWLTFGDPSLAQRLLLVLLPVLAAATAYRALVRLTGERTSATLAAGCYGVCAATMWALSEGRIDLLVMLAVVPVLIERIAAAFAAEPPQRWQRIAAGLGIALAIGVAFQPAVLLPFAVVLAVVAITAGTTIARGLRTSLAGIVIGAALVFPIVPTLLSAPDASFSSLVGTTDFAAIIRVVIGPAPGDWAIAWFLPVAAICSLVVVAREHRATANRVAIIAVAGILLSWLSAAGWLPTPLANAPAYTILVAACEAMLIGFGGASLVSGGIGRETFGPRQVLSAVLTFVLTLGLTLQVVAASVGDWRIRDDGLPPAWSVVSEQRGSAEFRVLWLGRAGGGQFLAPGGEPIGVVEAGPASVRYGLTGRRGIVALDTGRADRGPGYDELESSLVELVSGENRHTGALLAPYGIRFVVAAEGDLPAETLVRLESQLDLDKVTEGELTVYRNARTFPEASVVPADDRFLEAARSADPRDVAALPGPRGSEQLHAAPGGWQGPAPQQQPAYAFVGEQFATGWRLSDGPDEVEAERAFAWAFGFEVPEGADRVSIRYTDQWVRTLQILLLAVLWLAALWVTRKPVSSR
ncbi:MAG: glycosyltransferase family 2 protein [Actinomycetota bacterium]